MGSAPSVTDKMAPAAKMSKAPAPPPQFTPEQRTALEMRRNLTQIVHWHSNWRNGLYNFAIMGFLYEIYRLRGDVESILDQKNNWLEDMGNMQRILGVCVSLLLGFKQYTPVKYLKKIQDALMSMGVIELLIYAWLFSKNKAEHLPFASVYLFVVMLQEWYMDSERKNVVDAYNKMMDLLAAATIATPATAPATAAAVASSEPAASS